MTEQNDLVRILTIALAEMKQSLAAIAGAMATGLDIREPIQDYATFDWSSIGAEVARVDEDGPTVIRWNGKFYKRRSPSNKFEPSIWYSRCVGKNADGCDLKDRMAVAAAGCFQNSTAIGCFLAS